MFRIGNTVEASQATVPEIDTILNWNGLNREQLDFSNLIGSGNFAVVCKGHLFFSVRFTWVTGYDFSTLE